MSCVTLSLLPSLKLGGNSTNSNSLQLSNSLSRFCGNSSSSSSSFFVGNLSSFHSTYHCYSSHAVKDSRSFSSVFKCVSQKSEPSVCINANGNGASGKNWDYMIEYFSFIIF